MSSPPPDISDWSWGTRWQRHIVILFYELGTSLIIEGLVGKRKRWKEQVSNGVKPCAKQVYYERGDHYNIPQGLENLIKQGPVVHK